MEERKSVMGGGNMEQHILKEPVHTEVIINKETHIPMGVACVVAIFVCGILWKVSKLHSDITQKLALIEKGEEDEEKKISALFRELKDVEQRVGRVEGQLKRRGDTRT